MAPGAATPDTLRTYASRWSRGSVWKQPKSTSSEKSPPIPRSGRRVASPST